MEQDGKYVDLTFKDSMEVQMFKEENAQSYSYSVKFFTICKRKYRMFLKTEPVKEFNVFFKSSACF